MTVSTPALRKPRVASNAVGYQTVSYDAAGNELSYVVTRSYSSRNLLAFVTDAAEPGSPLHRVDYNYDGRGVRVIRSETQFDGTTASRYFTYSPELQLLSMTWDDRTNSWGNALVSPNALPAAKHEFVWFAGRPVAQFSSTFPTPTHWYMTDHLGTPVLQTDAFGAIAWRVEYEPYGDIWLQRVPPIPDEGRSPRRSTAALSRAGSGADVGGDGGTVHL